MNYVWTFWLITVGASFAVLEFLAWKTGGQMLTGWVREATLRWPWTPYLFGATAIALAFHFWLERK